MNDARLVNLAEHLIFPMLEAKISQKINEATGRLRNGEKDFLTEIAYIAALQELALELKHSQKRGALAFKKLEELKDE